MPSRRKKIVDHYVNNLNGKIADKIFSYNSKDNPNFLTINDLKKLISKIN